MTRRVHIDGIAVWAPTLPGWDIAAPMLRGEAPAPGPSPDQAPAPAPRPAPALLAANERRRAPDLVLLALEVASRALQGSGHDMAAIASVFASAHGDLAITDALCRTLAADPRLLSPTRFHHSVHNAASGYWAIASGSHAASTALAAQEHSVAAGLLEALTQCSCEDRPVLLVLGDTEALWPLASVNRSRGLLAAALVLSPQAGPASRFVIDWCLQPGAAHQPQAATPAAQALADNASAAVLPLLEALARGAPAMLAWPLSAALSLQLALQPLHGLNALPTAPAAA